MFVESRSSELWSYAWFSGMISREMGDSTITHRTWSLERENRERSSERHTEGWLVDSEALGSGGGGILECVKTQKLLWGEGSQSQSCEGKKPGQGVAEEGRRRGPVPGLHWTCSPRSGPPRAGYLLR